MSSIKPAHSMSKIYQLLVLIYSTAVLSHAQVMPYPQEYHLQGQVEYIQFISLKETWNQKKWIEGENNIIYFDQGNQPERVLFGKDSKVKEMNFEYENGLLQQTVAYTVDGDEFTKLEFTYKDSVLKERQISYQLGMLRTNATYTYQYLEGDTLVGQSERIREILQNGRLLSSKGETPFGEHFEQSYAYNDRGDISKTEMKDGDGKLIHEFHHTYEYDKLGNYIQKVTSNNSGDTISIFLRKIRYRGQLEELENPVDFAGKWLLLSSHPEFEEAAIILDFQRDNTFHCEGIKRFGLSESGRWAIDLKKKRLKVWFETIGMRVSYRIIAPGVLQLEWEELDSSRPDSKAKPNEVLLYKLN